MSPSFFFRVPEDAAHRVALPARRFRHLIDRCSLGSTQHRNDRILLRWTFGVGLRLRQCLDRQPQLIDQRIAVADFPALFDIGQGVPQRQQPLATERGCMQFLWRDDPDLLALYEAALRETVAVGLARGVRLPSDSIDLSWPLFWSIIA